MPLGLSAWAKAAKTWRGRLKERVPSFGDRRAFWQRFARAAWAEPDRKPTDADFDILLTAQPEQKGRVTLVGAGPGDPELLTLKAVRALQSATVILYDNLVGADVLELARREAKRISVGKSAHGPSCKQTDINDLMLKLASDGENVVRLKGGDPMIFGRATEEIDACRAAGIEISVIPGISAAQGAAASLLTSLTERKHARRVQFVTGHGADGKLPTDIDWISVADRKVTTVLYMPRKTLGEFVRKALAKGLDPATPAVAIAFGDSARTKRTSPAPSPRSTRSPPNCRPAPPSRSSSVGSDAATSVPPRPHCPSRKPSHHERASRVPHAQPEPPRAARGGEHRDLPRGRRRDGASGDALFDRQGQRGDAAPGEEGLLPGPAALPAAARRYRLEISRHVRAARQGRG